MFFYIPGELIAILTFPGVVLHEMAHKFFCDVNNVAVYAVDYFSIESKKSGYVMHGKVDSYWKAFFISFGPLIINTIVYLILLVPIQTKSFFGTGFLLYSTKYNIVFEYFLAWVGWSCGLHSIPSNQDIEALNGLQKPNFFRFFIFILTSCVKILNINSIGFWLKVVYLFSISRIFVSIFIS